MPGNPEKCLLGLMGDTLDAIAEAVKDQNKGVFVLLQPV